MTDLKDQPFKTDAKYIQRQLFAMAASGYEFKMKMGTILVSGDYVPTHDPMTPVQFLHYIDGFAYDEIDTLIDDKDRGEGFDPREGFLPQRPETHHIMLLSNDLKEAFQFTSDLDDAQKTFRLYLGQQDSNDEDLAYANLILKYVTLEDLNDAIANLVALSGEETRRDAAENYLDQWNDLYQEMIVDDPDADLSGFL